MVRPSSKRKAGKRSVKKHSGGMGWRKRDFLTHAEGRVFVRLLGLKSQKEWKAWSKSGQRPSNIPSNPGRVYRGKGWVSYPDWLGCERNKAGRKKCDYLPFASARAWVQQRNLKSAKEWQECSKSGQRPSNIPSHPYEVYRGKGWVSMMDFLGFEGKARAKKGDYLPFESARAWVQQRNLKSQKEWKAWSKSGQRPSNIPSHPDEVYRGKGWVSMPDWLGCERNKGGGQKGDYLPFASARAWVHQRNLKSYKEWKEWSKSGQRPSNIPSGPRRVYQDKGWVSMMDWLGTNTTAGVKRDFLPYEEARAWVHQHCNLKSKKEWREWSKSGQRPSNIPSNPDKAYRDKGWASMPDWLGCERHKGSSKRKRKCPEPASAALQAASSSSSSSSSSPAPAPLDNCAICFEPLCPVTTEIGHLACVHTFHVQCLDPLAHASAGPSTSSRRGVLLNCPLCRKRCRYLPEPATTTSERGASKATKSGHHLAIILK
eukprot:g1943.t1